MADVQYRGNLKAASFPFLSELQGRTVIVKGQDQNYIPQLGAKDVIDSSMGIPQLYYCHNVIPVDNGYRSVGYVEFTPSTFPSTTIFDDTFVIRDNVGNSALMTIDSLGNVYLMQTGTSTWAAPTVAPVAGDIAGRRCTVAFISGITYIYFAGHGCYIYDFATDVFTQIILLGVTAADILGIAGNSGYMLAWSVDTVVWSSTIDPTDFTPSLTTGAGGGSVEGLRGELVTVEEVYGGLIVFGSDNAVAATYSGNPRYPYNFTAIPGCGGLSDPDYITSDVGSGTLYAYTESGIQEITLRSAKTVYPDATDFLSGHLFEDYDEISDTLTLTNTAGTEILKKVALIADRYMIISYGAGALTHALYFDTALKQWGRLKIDHVDCFEFIEYSNPAIELPKRSVAFLGSGGSVHIMNSDIVNPDANGVMLVGKFQYTRSRLLQLHHAEIENIEQGATFSLLNLPTLDGKNFQTAVEGYLAESNGKFRKYNFRSTGLNHTLVWKGAFNATSFVLTFAASGGR